MNGLCCSSWPTARCASAWRAAREQERALAYLNKALDRKGAVAFDRQDDAARNAAVAAP